MFWSGLALEGVLEKEAGQDWKEREYERASVTP